jgi:hypothetical protein
MNISHHRTSFISKFRNLHQEVMVSFLLVTIAHLFCSPEKSWIKLLTSKNLTILRRLYKGQSPRRNQDNLICDLKPLANMCNLPQKFRHCNYLGFNDSRKSLLLIGCSTLNSLSSYVAQFSMFMGADGLGKN